MIAEVLAPRGPMPSETATGAQDDRIDGLIRASSAGHERLCPRQVLGVRMALHAGELLGVEVPDATSRLFIFIETDGCFLDSVAVASGCAVGHRTMRLVDHGKVAATFVDTATGRAVRLVPHPAARSTSARYAPAASGRWVAYLAGYRVMPADELFVATPVLLTVSLAAIRSRKSARAYCATCGEEVINEREMVVDGATLCRACAGDPYCVPMSRGPSPTSRDGLTSRVDDRTQP